VEESDTRIRDANPDIKRLREDTPPQRAWLLVHRGSDIATVPVDVGSDVVLGRSRNAGLQVDDPTVSRRHARFGRSGNTVWVEDLESANGTLVNGEKIDCRVTLSSGDEVAIGDVVVWLHTLEPLRDVVKGIEPHGRFLGWLEEEVLRATTFRRALTLVMIRPDGDAPWFLGQFCPRVRDLLRPVDKIGLYAADTIEVILSEVSHDEAIARVERLIREGTPSGPVLRCGVASLPGSSRSADELVEHVRDAIARATAREPIVLAPRRQTSVAPPPPSAAAPAPAPAPIIVSRAMRAVIEQAERAGGVTLPVLIHGETGAGKEIVAHAIHERGVRSGAPFVCLNCGAIPEQLVESVLFGHERGAFTGAHAQKKGVFESASGGSLFFDEVGELSQAAQAALLRAIETQRIRRVGGTDEVPVDVRIIAATHRDLERMCEAGRFRRDLLFRLNAMIIRVPPLRERTDEIMPMAEQFLSRARRHHGAVARGFAPDAASLLMAYQFPGNVRELRNIVEHAAVNARGALVSAHELNDRVRQQEVTVTRERLTDALPSVPLRDRVQSFERQLILDALNACNWNQSEAARHLNMPLRTLTTKLRTYNLRRPPT
jgi:DNA-binding NtrC family response regulator